VRGLYAETRGLGYLESLKSRFRDAYTKRGLTPLSKRLAICEEKCSGFLLGGTRFALLSIPVPALIVLEKGRQGNRGTGGCPRLRRYEN
jgi:hypothetical protein